MGKAVFQTEIIELGEQVDAFFEEGMFVLFGENVPDTLKDFCHFIDQKKVDGTITKEAGLPGSICVEAKPMPKLTIGSKLSIVEE